MAKKKRHILIIRLSALGDVAISVPLIKEYARENPSIQFSVLSQKFIGPLFDGVENLHFIPFELKKGNDGVFGLLKFASSLLKYNFTEVADIHGVHRSRVIRLWLRLHGIPYKSIFKNRSARKQLVRRENKVMVPLKSSMQKYEDVLVALGLKDLGFSNRPAPVRKQGKEAYRRIGIAPFAKHPGKAWPMEYVEEVIKTLSANNNNRIFLFGGGAKEIEALQEIAGKYPGTESVAGKYKLGEEVEFMKSLDVMLTMDSANMHLASLVQTPVVSVWGATHPYAGFYGWGQNPSDAVQIEMPCRPCSIYGNKKCFKGDYACLREVTPQQVTEKILEVTAR